MKKKGVFTVVDKLLLNIRKNIKIYNNIDKYGFPYFNKIAIISKFPKIVKQIKHD